MYDEFFYYVVVCACSLYKYCCAMYSDFILHSLSINCFIYNFLFKKKLIATILCHINMDIYREFLVPSMS